MRSAAMKQHPDSINRDLEDEVAGVIEHQYGRRLMKKADAKSGAAEQAKDAAPREGSTESKSGKHDVDEEMERLRLKSGF
jgi:hypothetical protein